MTEEEWLDPAVLEYITNNSGKVDYVDVVIHFQLSPDITLRAVRRLTDAGKIERKEVYWNIQPYRLVVKE
jgi:hypothetical protein